ncbi:MAG: prolyl oligopeptidase family serine peptidase [Erythrobacter sp.]
MAAGCAAIALGLAGPNWSAAAQEAETAQPIETAQSAETTLAEPAAAEPIEDGPQVSVSDAISATEKAPSAVGGKPPLISTEHFAARPIFSDAEISPNGSQIAFEQTVDGKSQVRVIDAATRKQISTLKVAADTRINWLRWAGDDRLLISVSMNGLWFGSLVRFSRLMLHEPATNSNAVLGPRNAVVDGDDVMFVAEDGTYALVSVQETEYDYPSVFRYELKPDGAVTEVQKPQVNVWLWYADDKGDVRLGMGWRRKRLYVYYRPDGTSEMKRIAKIKEGDADRFLDVVQIVSGSDKGYTLEEGENGRVGVRLFDYKTRQVVDTFYENPEWDVESIWLDKGKPIAAFYTDDRSQIVWFDKEYEAFYANLKKALGDQQIFITSRSKDGNRLLISVGSESDPGVLYLFDRKAGTMDELTPYRPNIDFRHTARPKAFTYTARDGTKIRAFLTLPKGREAKNLPLIMHPHGGPFGVRDELRYDDQVQFLANRGYAVIQPNFRGSGGYGDEFFNLGFGQVGRGMQDDIDDAMDWAVAEGIADPSRVCVVGGSYGGYAALWAVLRNPERYRCAASWAGVTDWDKMLSYDRRVLSREAGKRWENRIEGDDKSLDLDDVSPYKLAKTLNRPVLLAHGTADSNVPIKQYTIMEKAARKAPVKPTSLVIKGEGHSFSKAESEQKWYDALEVFLAEHNPSDVNRKEAE